MTTKNKEAVYELRLPRYDDIPNVGLYLEQVVRYVNENLAALDAAVTLSMVSNYVKKGYIARPVKKLYYRDQIAYIMFIALAKQALSMENIMELFELQKATYDIKDAYNYFCTELEKMLGYIFGKDERPPEILTEAPFAKKMLRSLVVALSHMIYLNYHLKDE